MYTLDISNLVKDLEVVHTASPDEPFPFLSQEDREAGDFPIFLRIMKADTPEDVKDISLDQVVGLFTKVSRYSSHLDNKTPIAAAALLLRQCVCHLPKRRVL